ncbi:hypothetical protein E0765_01645 [Sulfuricurvum sp. IAE1]|jgi:CBS domain-containing protein|uniref:CBS domain-containing protein n=1 Tax=Sulfuricurvum sp. IAE1 TaxID=2546102 RepID=UPI001049D13F|nr:CBS domain-containing protein [Sulfuricurvum sp. IAE1]MDX9965698.1 hypothetical protein [Sulfuricurvum sp.]TDA69147.1 hypothetical protein E0765_01645 [Sulfuricurvum sp. IAE1]
MIKKFWTEHIVFVLGSMLSIILLVIFFIFQYNESVLLNLETRWLLVAGIPLLATLFIGGYIKSFKGFGVELEAKLKNSVSTVILTATAIAKELKSGDKGSAQYLQSLLEQSRPNLDKLVFTEGKQNYYDVHMVSEYIEKLSSLKYIEIQDSSGKFLALIPISTFKNRQQNNSNNIARLIRALEEMNIFSTFDNVIIKTAIEQDTLIIDALRLMKKQHVRKAVVVDENKKFVGLLEARVLEQRIAEEVLSTIDTRV